MRILIRLIFALLIASIALADNPPPRIQDEGGTLAPYFNLNCVGSSITCSTSGVNATLTATDDDVPESGDFGNLTAGTNLTWSPAGTLNVDNPVVANLTGNASTATALAANGANCSAGNYPLGVDASGAAESCTADDDIPESGDLAAATLQVVTTAGQTTSAGVTLLDDTNLTFGTSGNITAQWDLATGKLVCDNVLNSDTAEIYLDDIQLRSDYDAADVGGVPINLSLTTYRGTVDMSVQGVANSVTLNRTSSAYNNSQSATGFYNYLSFQNPNSATGTTLYGLKNTVAQTAAGSVASMYGIEGTVQTSSGSAVNGTIEGIRSVTTTNATNTDVSSFAVGNVSFSGAGTTTNYYGLKLFNPSVSGSLTNSYGLYIPTWTGGTNNYPIWIADAGKAHFREAGTSINSSASGNLDLTAATAINVNTGSLIIPADNQKILIGDTGSRGSLYDDGTNLVINPQEAGSGAVFIGNTGQYDLTADQMSLCSTAIDSLAVMRGTCSSSSGRGVLDFKFTKTGSNGVAGNILSQLTNNTSAASPTQTGVQSTMNNQTTAATPATSTFNAFKAIMAQNSDVTAGTASFRGFDITDGHTATDGTGATFRMIGVQQRQFSSITGATMEKYGSIWENDVLITSNDKLVLEGSGGNTPSLGDSYFVFNSSTTDVDNYVDATKTQTWDNDWVDLFVPTTVAANFGVTATSKIGFEDVSGTAGDTFFQYDSTDTDLELTVDGTQVADYDNDQIDYAVPIQQDACRSGFTRMGLGCIQTDEEGSGTWDAAREDCYDTYGGRLPTPFELQAAANNIALTNETDDEEWTSHITHDDGTVECGYQKLNAGTADESADFAEEACGTSEAYRCFIPFAGGN